MEINVVYIEEKDSIFGFVEKIPAICSQGKTKDEVKEKIERYLIKYLNLI